MRIVHEGGDTLKVSMSEEKAAHLLAGLREDGDELGELAVSLAGALEAAGVTPPDEPDVTDFERPGPND